MGAAAGHNVVAVDVVGQFGVEVLLAIDFAGLRQFKAVAATGADKLDPAVPGFRIQIGQRAVNSGVFLHGVDRLQGAEDVILLDQAAQQADRAGVGHISGFHKAGIAAGILAAEHCADAHRLAQAGGAGVCVRSGQPGVCIQAQNLPALVVADIAAGHAALDARGLPAAGRYRTGGFRLRPHHAAAGHAVGGAVADGGDKDLQTGKNVVDVQQLFQHIALGQQLCHIAGFHFADVTAGALAPDNVREVVRVGILNMAAGDCTGKAAGVADEVVAILRGSPHGVAAGCAVDVGMFHGRDNDIEGAEEVAQADSFTQNIQAAAHTGCAADINFADKAARVPPAGDGADECVLVITAAVGVQGLCVGVRVACGVGDLGVAQEVDVAGRDLRTAGVPGKTAGAAGIEVAVFALDVGSGDRQADVACFDARSVDHGDIGVDDGEQF